MFHFLPNQMQNQVPFPPYQMHFPQYPYQIPTQQSATKGIGSKLLGKMSSGNFNLESFLTNIQKALGMAEQITPMIQQYGPLIKSAPALLQLLKDDSDDDDLDYDTDDEEDSDNNEENDEKNDSQANKKTENDSENKSKKRKRKPVTPKQSVPKLYI